MLHTYFFSVVHSPTLPRDALHRAAAGLHFFYTLQYYTVLHATRPATILRARDRRMTQSIAHAH
jgi:hypothetical protein